MTEKLIRRRLGEALSRGADYADVFFQHQVANTYCLEDGEVNRAFASVELGVGVRVVKGDQTGYAYTEDLTPEALARRRRPPPRSPTGPSRPVRGLRAGGLPARYPVKTRWEDVRPQQKLPLLAG